MQDDKGNVTLQFPKQEGSSSRIYTQGSRTSSHPWPFFEMSSWKSSVKLDNVDFTLNIPYPRYVTQESLPTSPTLSQMMPEVPNQLMVIDSMEPLQKDKDYLRKELHLPKLDQKRNWFFSNKLTAQTRNAFRVEWYKCMEKNRIDIPMFTYSEMYASNKKLTTPS